MSMFNVKTIQLSNSQKLACSNFSIPDELDEGISDNCEDIVGSLVG
jgi:hypothetical protein